MPKEKEFLLDLKKQTVPKSFNLWEKITVLRQAFRLNQNPGADIFRKVCEIIGLPNRPEIIISCLKIRKAVGAGRQKFLQKCLEENRIHFNLLGKLGNWPAPDSESFGKLVRQFSLNSNQAAEIFNLLGELAQKQNCSLKKLIQKLKLFSALKLKTPPEVKIKKIKGILMKTRYPLFSSYQEKAQKIIRDLKWPPALVIKHPDFFEDTQWQIMLKFKNITELKNLMARLKNLPASQDFQKFLQELD